jgi:hypothetical protein
LAQTITSLSPAEQQALLEKVAHLNLQKGWRELSEKYRARLACEGRLSVPAEAIWQELERLRQEVAERDYPG